MNPEKTSKLEQLIAVLGGEDLQFTGTEIADFIWLTGQIQQKIGKTEEPKPVTAPEPQDVSPQTPTSQEADTLPPQVEFIPKTVAGSSTHLTVAAPDASSLGTPLDIARSLRILQQIGSGSKPKILDENATAEKMARHNRLPLPVFTSPKESGLDLSLVIDGSQSMVFWESTLKELKTVLKRYGIFRSLDFWQIQPTPGEKSFSLCQNHPPRTSNQQAPLQSGNRRLILIVTDAIADYWYNGEMLKCLQKWGKSSSVSLLQMLPDWLWLRTGLRLGAAVRLGTLITLPTNQDLLAKEILIQIGIPIQSGTKVPVFTLEPKAVREWSRMMAGKSEARTSGFVFARNFRPPSTANSQTLLQGYTPQERVQRFQNLASPQGKKLARLLAAAPAITLPVVRLIQRTMLPESQSVHVAEVFLGGLLRPINAPPDEIVYEFVSEEIRDIFLDGADPRQSLEVLDAVSKYVARRLKRTLREFAALLKNPEPTQAIRGNLDLNAFAKVEAKVLKRLGGEAQKFAEDLERIWSAHQQKQALTVQFPWQWSSFTFTTPTVNRRGEVIAENSYRVNYYTEDLGDGVSLEMVYIPGGTFMMGTEDEEIERLCKKYDTGWFRNEAPRHEVTVPPFFMSRYPITQEQWRVIARLDRVERNLQENPSYKKGDKKPVESVQWSEVVKWCKSLSRLTQKNYKLPTEAQWEYACRAGTTTPFYFGETLTSQLANYRGSSVYAEEREREYRGETTEVGKFPPNTFGLYDMHGQVWEWCEDSWHENYRGAPVNGSAWIDEKNSQQTRRVLRGGSWSYAPRLCRSAYRNLNPYGSHYAVGFRVVCVPQGS